MWKQEKYYVKYGTCLSITIIYIFTDLGVNERYMVVHWNKSNQSLNMCLKNV